MRPQLTMILSVCAAAFVLGACTSAPTRDSTLTLPSNGGTGVAHADAAAEGLGIAEARCAACHAVITGEVSPNSDAPPFSSIAQRPDLSDATAYDWLRHSRDFPDQMNFHLDRSQAEALAAYLLTLRQTNSE